MERGGLKYRFQRCCAACFANLGLKLIALVIAVVTYLLVHRPPSAPKTPPTCPPSEPVQR